MTHNPPPQTLESQPISPITQITVQTTTIPILSILQFLTLTTPKSQPITTITQITVQTAPSPSPRYSAKCTSKDGSVHYRDYAAQYAGEFESIYQSIIRRAAYRPDLQDAKKEAEELIGQFDRFMEERDPGYQPFSVPDQLITKSLSERMDESEPWIFDPGDYFDLDQDYFYYCLCGYCEQCDEVNYFFEFMRELQEEYEDP